MNAKKGLVILITLVLLTASQMVSASEIPLWENRQLVIDVTDYQRNPKVFLNETGVYMIFQYDPVGDDADFWLATQDPITGEWTAQGAISSLNSNYNEYDSMVWGSKIYVTSGTTSIHLLEADWNGVAATSPLTQVSITGGNANIFEIFITHLAGQSNPWLYFGNLSSNIRYFEMTAEPWAQSPQNPTYAHTPPLGSTDMIGMYVEEDASWMAVAFECSGTIDSYCLGASDTHNIFLLLPTATPDGLTWTFIDWSNDPAYNPASGGIVSCGGPFKDFLGCFYVGCGYGIYRSTPVNGDGWCEAKNHEDLVSAGLIKEQYETQTDCCDPTCKGLGCFDPSWSCPGTECILDTDCADWCSGDVCETGFCVDSGLGNPCPENNDVCDGITTCNSTINECDTSTQLDCSDNLFCNGTETCDPIDGCEAGTPPSCPDDGLYCNGTEFCDEAADACGHQSVPSCPSDGLWCNGTEYCNEGSDSCDHQNPPSCPNDGLYCNGTEFCDEAADACGHQSVPSCPNDGLWCNGTEYCNEASDSCDHQNPPDCADTFACTADSCNETSDQCDHAPNDSLCDDGEWCNGAEICTTATGCKDGSPPCDPEFEICDEASDQCLPIGDDDDTGDDDTTDDDTGDDDTTDDDTTDDDTTDDDTDDDDSADDDTTPDDDDDDTTPDDDDDSSDDDDTDDDDDNDNDDVSDDDDGGSSNSGSGSSCGC